MKRFDLLKLPDILITLLFLVIITTTLWAPLLQIQDIENNEKRELASMPEIQWSDSLLAFPEEFRLYFSDHFPLRYRMIRLSNQIRYYLFQERFISDVIIGEDGWLYFNAPIYTDICQNSIDWRNFDRYTEKINSTQKFLNNRGVEFAIVFIPEKCHVYPETIQHILPDFEGKSSTQPLIEYISNNSEVTVINLFDVLNYHKNSDQLFYKNDTHWTSYGAYLGYRGIIINLFPDLTEQEVIPWNYSKEIAAITRTGDLGNFSSLPEFISETTYVIKEKRPLTPTTLEKGVSVYENPDAENDLTLVVFHDSFFQQRPIKDYLATHFRRTVFLYVHEGYKWSNNHADLEDLVDTWDPDIVMFAHIERFIRLLRNE